MRPHKGRIGRKDFSCHLLMTSICSLRRTRHWQIMEITEPTPIQAEAIPALLAGNDLVGQSATGSGKTLAYGVPLVERLARDKRVVQALVLLPTRELAVQVHAVLGTAGNQPAADDGIAGRRTALCQSNLSAAVWVADCHRHTRTSEGPS